MMTTTMIPRLLGDILLALVLLLAVLASTMNFADAYHFAMVSGNSPFFYPIEEGWNDTCASLPGVTCEHWYSDWRTTFPPLNLTYNSTIDRRPCVTYIRYLIERGDVDAIAAKCNLAEDDPGASIIQDAADAGIPVVVFAGPHVGPYVSYIGTDNYELGKAMARLLKQLRPEGGTYVATYNGPSSEERAIGFVEEIEKDNNRDDKAHWIEEPLLNTSALGWDESDFKGVTSQGMDGIIKFLDIIAESNPTAIGFMYQTPMRHENYTDFVDRNRWRNMSYLGTEGNADELQFMARNYVDGLVGQQTYDMGRFAAQALYRIMTEGPDNIPPKFGTKLINYNLVPDELPELKVDQSLLGGFKYIGYACFGVVAAWVFVCTAWSIWYRQTIVVKASQPFFLVMTATGVLIMAGTIIPLSFDDNGQDISESRAVGICMSIPWLAFSGFTVTFSALFAKTWRVNKFFKSSSSHARIKVSEGDVLSPFLIIFTLNVVVLLCWTMIDPLTYERRFAEGTDLWNRDIASNGACRSDNSIPYLVPLGLINFIVLATACWQAVEARDIQCEFSEAKWIGLAVGCMAQGFLTGIPIVAVAKDIPEAFYLIMTFLMFVICMVVLLLIFLPKIIMERKYSKMSVQDQKRAMSASVRRSAGHQLSSQVSGLPSATFRRASDKSSNATNTKKGSGSNEENIPASPEASKDMNSNDQVQTAACEVAKSVGTNGADVKESETKRSNDDASSGAYVQRSNIDNLPGQQVIYSSYIDDEVLDA